ncbi:aldehyde dehydrogenase (NADP(+)) [Marinomonas sp. 15G1-11]|uniref:Aldehyde dehydrogenase (NADP(+)) n=1 Tax=Marinomonas phaeophyticola TaxID=3004091 RepID=A0ABT4JUA2_9GAMM|nr:aldehyde dehydrogenase (NADP(+)) [Marinomonas sp. 15G1-11]MCZ2721986.1 aldehyde dehydrogenase (NADP(+)) [Marinomonas sp. 15G1-11]
MQILGHMLIGQQSIQGHKKAIHALNPVTNECLDPAFLGGDQQHVDQAAALAWQAFDAYRAVSVEQRAAFLECIADEILALGDALVERAMAESGLPKARIEGERGRTMGQLRMFASVVRMGKFVDARIDPAIPDRAPLPRSDLRFQKIPLGPVAVFGASNFPLAFSVAGGDTASALAAGCPVIVKAHSAHPGTSELVGRAIQTAIKKCALPEGVFSLLFGAGADVGGALVAHPCIKAVGFTGSRSGGMALMNIAANRPEPIPVYAEMSSINPVFVMPSKLAQQAESIASGFVASLAMGAGQFCTNPGLVVLLDGEGTDDFLAQVAKDTEALSTQTMLTPGIYQAYCDGVNALAMNDKVTLLAKAKTSSAPNQCQTHVFVTDAPAFLNDKSLENEVFGSNSLIIKCQTIEEYRAVAEHLEGQLTATIQMSEEDVDAVAILLPILERKAGRLLCNGYPTGVEVCHSMVHGGPFPATSDSRSTSVGSAAIDRFVRPVCYQDFPAALLPVSVQDNNPLTIPQLVDGVLC